MWPRSVAAWDTRGVGGRFAVVVVGGVGGSCCWSCQRLQHRRVEPSVLDTCTAAGARSPAAAAAAAAAVAVLLAS